MPCHFRGEEDDSQSFSISRDDRGRIVSLVMRLLRVTITGADDATSPDDLLALSKEFPFVEWGFLYSPKRSGSGEPRYPTVDWIMTMVRKGVNVALHLCGQAARDFFAGTPRFWMNEFKRIQVNGFSNQVEFTGMMPFIAAQPTEFIMQATTPVALLAVSYLSTMAANIVPLYDPSGGRGIVQKEWPVPSWQRADIGYAGGMGPDNVEIIVRTLSGVPRNLGYWIDMETKVRTPDGTHLDLKLVREVLEKVLMSQVSAPERVSQS